MTFAREPLQVVELVQPLCALSFGVAPCTAVGDKCWNTDATCKDVANLDLTDEIAIRFVAPAANRALASGFQPSTAIPALVSVQAAPTVLNVGAGNEDLSPLGLRAVAQVAIRDFPSNDVGFDPYLSDRAYDPVTRGSFWTKWLARNPFHVGYTLRIYDGFFGDALSAMIKREYSIERIDLSRDAVQITAKDILRRVTDTDVTAPDLSRGALASAITSSEASLTVAGAALDDYPASGWVRIGDEIIAYTSRATSGSNIAFSGLTRARLGTVAAAHSQGDRVQRVLAYVDQPFSDIIYDLLTTWGGIPAGFIDKTDWDDEFAEWRELYRFTAYLSDPVSVQRLVGELCQQGLANVWWDERVQKILFRAQRPNFAPDTITQEGEIVADSVVVTEHPNQRASQVYVYHSLRSPVLPLGEKSSYASAEAFIDVDKERQYGEAQVKEIFCRWVRTGVIARSLGSAYLLRFRDVRRHITFNLTAKDIANLWTGDVIQIRHFLEVDFTGAERVRPWLITSAETVEQGGVYRFVAEDNLAGGLLWEWVDDGDTRPSTEIGAWVDENGTDGSGNRLPYAWV
jgi:hypothetical protein